MDSDVLFIIMVGAFVLGFVGLGLGMTMYSYFMEKDLCENNNMRYIDTGDGFCLDAKENIHKIVWIDSRPRLTKEVVTLE